MFTFLQFKTMVLELMLDSFLLIKGKFQANEEESHISLYFHQYSV